MDRKTVGTETTVMLTAEAATGTCTHKLEREEADLRVVLICLSLITNEVGHLFVSN